ncbi:SMI1/KNR4 family protein [Undibacterium sp. RuTC16W]|uniref:SMI1/KNR4 family protein n=1 Tax=Undibacterium sp. RuTC16W TaxID=3413048 RepID=UPI003BF132AC
MKNSTRSWLFSEGASSTTLRELSLQVGPLPDSYLELLGQGNGGEVGLKVSPFNFCLDTAESALDYWKSGTYTASGVFVFGCDGGGSLFAFDLSTSGKWPVVCFDPIDPEGSMEAVAPDFESLIGQLAENG